MDKSTIMGLVSLLGLPSVAAAYPAGAAVSTGSNPVDAWPGNVRELRNVLTRAFVLGGTRIDAEDLSFHELTQAAPTAAGSGSKGTLKDAQRGFILSVLKKHDNNRSAAARELGIARSTLHYKMKTLGIQ